MVKEITDSNYKEEVIDNSNVVLIDFWAPWCGPCKMQGPIVQEIGKEYEGKSGITIAKMNVDENPQTAQAHGIMSIPTLIIFKDGKVAESFIGLQSKEFLTNALKNHSV